jgi:CubicO group peptidase (beta-lactamase class C family)
LASQIKNKSKTNKKHTKDTLWQVASLSKNITVTCLAWLQGVNVDNPINDNGSIKVEFSTKVVTENMNIRDCMSHTTCAPPQIAKLPITYGYSKRSAYKIFKYCENYGFKNKFQYTDMAYTLGFENAASINNKGIVEQLEDFFQVAGLNETM